MRLYKIISLKANTWAKGIVRVQNSKPQKAHK